MFTDDSYYDPINCTIHFQLIIIVHLFYSSFSVVCSRFIFEHLENFQKIERDKFDSSKKIEKGNSLLTATKSLRNHIYIFGF